MSNSAVVIHIQQSLFPQIVEPIKKVAAFYQRDEKSSTDEWYTPAVFIEAARDVLGAIDLDPATCQAANHVVQARQIFTVSDNGLNQEWHGRVWLNPPYSDTELWTGKLLEEYQAGHVTEAIMTIFANTGTKYFQPLWDYPMCFPIGRIKFINLEKPENSATKDSVFVYMGPNESRFREVFRAFGPVGRLV